MKQAFGPAPENWAFRHRSCPDRKRESMSKAMDQALKDAGFKVKKRRDGKRWPRKKGGLITVTMTIDREFVPGTGFAVSFIAVDENKKGNK